MTVARNIVKWTRSNGVGEDMGHQFSNLQKQRGIVHKITVAYSQESNGGVEQLNCSMMNMAKILLIGMTMVQCEVWAEAVNSVC